MIESLFIGVGSALFLLLMFFIIQIGETVKERGQMTPEQERQYEIENMPVYAFATITSENCEEVISAEILHIQDPSRYPAVQAMETRKKEA